MKPLHISLILVLLLSTSLRAQDVETELNTSEISNMKPSYDLEDIKKTLYVPKDHKCDTSVILDNKKTFANCFYNGIETFNIAHLGRENIKGEGPQLLFTTENYYLENGKIKYIHEKEYYHHVEKTTKAKTIRSWEGYYVVENGKATLVEEVEDGKKRRPDFNEQEILKFYQDAIVLLESGAAIKLK